MKAFIFTFIIGVVFGNLFPNSGLDCRSNKKLAFYNESEAKALINKQIVIFSPKFACFNGDLNQKCIDIESDSVGEIIGIVPVYKIDRKLEVETKNIEDYKLIVKWKSIDSNYTSYLVKESYFTEYGKEINLYKILD